MDIGSEVRGIVIEGNNSESQVLRMALIDQRLDEGADRIQRSLKVASADCSAEVAGDGDVLRLCGRFSYGVRHKIGRSLSLVYVCRYWEASVVTGHLKNVV